MMFRDSEIRRFGWLGKVNPEGLHLPFDMREDMFGIRQFLDAQGRQAMRFEFFCDFVGGQMAADIRKFPETCEQALGRAFVQGNIFPLTQHEDGEFFHAPFFLDDFDGKFLRAARVMGESAFTIIVREIIPNIMGLLITNLTMAIPSAIFQEAFLSYIGLGISPPQASWGVLAKEGTRMMTAAPHMLYVPAFFICTTVLALNQLGNGLRDAFDPRLRGTE